MSAAEVRSSKKRGKQKLVQQAVIDGDFPFNDEFCALTMPQRVAFFLNWSAANYPNEFVPHQMIWRAITGLKRTPIQSSPDALRVKNMMGRVRVILQKDYARDLYTQPFAGVRATVDDADALQSTLPRRMRRLRSAREAVTRTAELIDVKKLPNTPQMTPWKRWFATSVQDVLGLLNSDNFTRGLLPPGATAHPEKKTEKKE